jgi:hypothetical protein
MGRLEVLLLGALVWVGAMAWIGIRGTQLSQAASPLDQVSNENRARLAPIRRLYDQMRELIEKNESQPAVKIIGAEALAEAEHVLRQSVQLLQLRKQLVSAAGAQGAAERDLSDLQLKLETAASEEERESYRQAIAARSAETHERRRASESIERVDAFLRRAEAALSEMHSRIAVAAAGAETADQAGDELGETILRLRDLTKSFDEAEELVRGRIG